ncbi:P1 family peptidase [Chryseolinea sp. T2]|uniref:DmpA family aminopeptidase n=1 Tax=Chryseolinea sp. T2 TaxID=3129255 RepID=UPI003076DD86
MKLTLAPSPLTLKLLRTLFFTLLFTLTSTLTLFSQSRGRTRDYGFTIGVMKPGAYNAITDVKGVLVGHTTLNHDNVRTGVTAILPYDGNIFQQKVPAGVFVGNGFGKLSGTTQVMELGTLETPIVLTNTLNVSTAMDALIGYTLAQPGNEKVQSVNAVVGETNDGYLNDIRGRHVTKDDVLKAIGSASGGPVAEGNVGAGTGTICFEWKGGIGTSSRVLSAKSGGYTVGVLVQTNFGGVLQIDGLPVGEALRMHDLTNESSDGSCMIIVATDAPLDSRNLQRLAKRAFMGLARSGGIASNGSGDYVIAFSTAASVRIPHNYASPTIQMPVLMNDEMTPLFAAAIEATEEAIINSLFKAETMTGKDGHIIKALPIDEVIRLRDKQAPRK